MDVNKFHALVDKYSQIYINYDDNPDVVKIRKIGELSGDLKKFHAAYIALEIIMNSDEPSAEVLEDFDSNQCLLDTFYEAVVAFYNFLFFSTFEPLETSRVYYVDKYFDVYISFVNVPN